MLVNYPMLPTAKMLSIMGDKITRVVFARVNGTNFMYTGTEEGMLYEWVETGLQEY